MVGSNPSKSNTCESSSHSSRMPLNPMMRQYSSYSECSSYSSGGEKSPSVSRPSSPDFTQEYHSLIERVQRRIQSKDRFFSLEFVPPKTKSGAVNLLARLERISHGKPLFCDVTWRNYGDSGSDAETSSMTIAGAALNYCGLETMLHMTCCNMTKEEVCRHLRKARDLGLRNILALRGDPLPGRDWRPMKDGFSHAINLVRHIRQTYGDYFVIGVAGYPHGHPECVSYEDDLRRLKEKVDAGANFIITQLFFKAETFLKYVDDCRQIGIQVPIIPGIMPIQNYDSLRHIMRLAKVDLPIDVLDCVETLKDNDEAIRNYGISLTVDMIKELLVDDRAPGIHIYTLNREFAAVTILRKVGLWCEDVRRSLPWKVAANARRCSEDVRPIFWSSRPKSYIYRTQNWDEFPNGRWGSSDSPAFGDLKDYYLFFMQSKSSEDELLRMWGEELTCEQDVFDVFYSYISTECNKNDIKVTRIPWNDDKLRPETEILQQKLMNVNKRGVLTINSQPNVNGVPSGDSVVGWGPPGGYVYQKAYLEFFTCKENVVALMEILPRFPTVNYHIINNQGDENHTNCHKHRPIAVTWGVFPGREIIQPTIVDPDSFKVWKDEAFALWQQQWGRLYPENSTSQKLIMEISDRYYLVNLVDNDFVRENCLWDVIEAMFEHKVQMELSSRVASNEE